MTGKSDPGKANPDGRRFAYSNVRQHSRYVKGPQRRCERLRTMPELRRVVGLGAARANKSLNAWVTETLARTVGA